MQGRYQRAVVLDDKGEGAFAAWAVKGVSRWRIRGVEPLGVPPGLVREVPAVWHQKFKHAHGG